MVIISCKRILSDTITCRRDDVADGVLSAILICLAILFLSFFLPQVAYIMVKMCVRDFDWCGKPLEKYSKRVRKWREVEVSSDMMVMWVNIGGVG